MEIYKKLYIKMRISKYKREEEKLIKKFKKEFSNKYKDSNIYFNEISGVVIYKIDNFKKINKELFNLMEYLDSKLEIYSSNIEVDYSNSIIRINFYYESFWEL